MERQDDRFDYGGEVRIYALGLVQGVVMVVIYEEADDERRIISAWKASRSEARYYYREIFGDEDPN